MRVFFKIRICTFIILTTYTLILYAGTHLFNAPYSVYTNGVFITDQNTRADSEKRVSEEGSFSASFSAGPGEPESRELQNFEFLKGGAILFRLAQAPGSDVSISNAGYLIFYDHTPSPTASLVIHCYSKNGEKIFSRGFNGADVFGFSPQGNQFGVVSNKGLEVISLSSGTTALYRKGYLFDISSDETKVAVAYEGGIAVYSNGRCVGEIKTGMSYTRKIRISPDNNRVAVIDKNRLHVYSLKEYTLTFSDMLTGNNSFRDLRLDNTTAWAGIHYKDEKLSRGILKTYNLQNKSAVEQIKASEPRIRSGLDIKKFNDMYVPKTRDSRYPKIPWPFSPQNQAHKMWNNYEALNTSADAVVDTMFPYLHQGIDMECPKNTKVYAVADGFVKFVITLGGDIYWRTATAEVQVPDYSDGWLYAHLIQSTIQVDAGDQVKAGDYLGDIVYWSTEVDGHLHFARIRDHGTVWSYDDDEYGIVYNPELSLTPNSDTTPPVIVAAIANKSKFGYYSKNNTDSMAVSSAYYYPDSARGGVKGNVDIIVKLYDYTGYKAFTQPAYSLYYWIKGIDKNNCWSNYNKLIIDTTLAQIRNRAYPFNSVTKLKPYAAVMYKYDKVFVPGGWFSRTRNFAHVLTNNNGDTAITPGEKDSCLHTAKYYDGWYRVYVKAFDCKGYSVVDSENVYFNNGNHDPTPVVSGSEQPITGFWLGSSFSGNYSTVVTIQFHVPVTTTVSLKVYDLLGNEVKNLAHGLYKPEKYSVKWDGTDNRGNKVGAGMYLYRLQAGHFYATRKVQVYR